MAVSTKFIAGVLAASLACVLSGCVLRGKPVAKPTAAAPKPNAGSPPAPVALSTPQTQVQLPKPQPIDPAAIPAETAAAPPPDLPVPPRPNPSPRSTTPRTNPLRSEPSNPPASPPVTEVARQPIQEIVPAADLKRLQESAQTHKREVTRILSQLNERRLSQQQKSVVKSIRSFLSLSDQAEKRNDMRQADALAERAHILARDFQHGK